MNRQVALQILLFVLFLLLSVAGFLHVPILQAFGVNVFNYRGLLVILFLPIVVITTLPFAIYLAKIIEKRKKK